MDTRMCDLVFQMALEFVRNNDDLTRLYDSVCSPSFPAATMEALTRKLGEQLMRHSHEPGGMEAVFGRFFAPTHYTLPDPPVSAEARLSALLPDDDVDRLTGLPDSLLGYIVSRLPVKEAARTAALSRRWRGVWRSAPLVLADADLFPGTSAVSRVLAEHPGPFRCVHIASCYMEDFHGLLTSWLQLFAGKGIQELVLVNLRWPLDLALPSAVLGVPTLTSLYLGLWQFPDTAGLPRATCFPNLRDLGLCSVLMENTDLDFILDRSPVLETLCVEGNLFKLRLRLVSQSLRCVQIIGSFEEIFVVNAPRLERLIHSEGCTPDGSCNEVKIGHSPKLRLLGYLQLDPGNQVLKVGNTVIKAGTRASPRTMVPSVRILAMEVWFNVRNDAKMTPSILRCFPNIETLHIKSGKTHQSTGKLNLKFWNESGTIECIRSCIKRLVFHDFRGDRSELAFLKFFFGSALVLEDVVILLDAGFTSIEEVHSKVKSLGSMKRGSETSSVLVTGCSDPQGDYIRSLKRGSDFSIRDPFANY